LLNSAVDKAERSEGGFKLQPAIALAESWLFVCSTSDNGIYFRPALPAAMLAGASSSKPARAAKPAS